MGVVEVMIAGMVKLLVPKEASSASTEHKDRGRVDREEKRKKGKTLATGSNKTGDHEVQGRRGAVRADNGAPMVTVVRDQSTFVVVRWIG
jgi:hypothetical protein